MDDEDIYTGLLDTISIDLSSNEAMFLTLTLKTLVPVIVEDENATKLTVSIAAKLIRAIIEQKSSEIPEDEIELCKNILRQLNC